MYSCTHVPLGVSSSSLLGIGPRDPPCTLILRLHHHTHTTRVHSIRSKRRRRLLQLVLLVSPSLRIGPTPFARGSRHARPGRGQSASCRRCSVAASASPPPSVPKLAPCTSSGGFSSSPPRSSPSRDSRPICCRSGHSPASLVACRSDAGWHLHSTSNAPPPAPVRRRQV